MFRTILLFSLLVLTNSKAILPKNITTTTRQITSSFSTQTTPIETSTLWQTTTMFSTPMITTTLEYKEETTRVTVENKKSFAFQSNFTRNNDSVFVAVHSDASNVLVAINNTFTDRMNNSDPCEITFNEHSTDSTKIINTKISINFNGSLTRELAIQIGDRLIDIVDLLSTVRSMANTNNTIEPV